MHILELYKGFSFLYKSDDDIKKSARDEFFNWLTELKSIPPI